MSSLSKILPAYTPDLGGVCSALFELGGMLIIHDAAGCTENYTTYDEPRWFGSDALLFSSGLTEMDAIMGNDAHLIDRVVKAASLHQPKFIAIVGSPVPMVIGTDFDGIAYEVEEATGIPTFGFSTTSLGLYDKGAGEAFVKLAKRFCREKWPTRPGSLNLLGATPLDFSVGPTIPSLRDFFEGEGYRVIASLAMGSTLEEIGRSTEAEVNVVLSASGLPVARYFWKAHGIPYVVGLPVGHKGGKALLERIKLARQTGESSELPKAPVETPEILVLGDVVVANSIRTCLIEDHGLKGVQLGNIFTPHPAALSSGDLVLESEEAIQRAFASTSYSLILGDPLFKSLLPTGFTGTFLDVPIPAVSSRLWWDRCIDYTAGQFNQWFEKIDKKEGISL